MKLFLAAVLLFVSFFSAISLACQNGDTSKTLLVIHVSEAGEENAIIGEIRTSDNNITITHSDYALVGVQGDWITVDYFGKTYSFNRLNAQQSVFCFKAIFAEEEKGRCNSVLGK
jgi:hypothetical protein